MNAKLVQHIEKTIIINATVQCIYNQCSRFKEFSRFIPYIMSLRQSDDFPMVQIGFCEKRFKRQAEKFQQMSGYAVTPCRGGCRFHHGSLTLESEGGNTTRVTVELDYAPYFPLGASGVSLCTVEEQIEKILKRFRDFVEPQPADTEEWSDEIPNEAIPALCSEPYAWTRY